MAKVTAKGSIILELLIVILVIALIATILYPKRIWEQEDKNTQLCRARMDQIFKAELIYQKYHYNYTDTLTKLISFIKNDSTKATVREYFYADTALAETMTDFLTQSDSTADLTLRKLMADTLMYAIIEAINYDSNLAQVILNRHDNSSLAKVVKAKRATGNNDVAILKELDRELSGLAIYEPIKDDDSLKLVFDRMIPEVPVGSLLDTLYSLNPVWAQQIDSAVFFTLDNFTNCPTINREYKITVIDTSVIKYVDIQCPLDSIDIEHSKKNWIEYYLGHKRIENHGKIETGEKIWAR